MNSRLLITALQFFSLSALPLLLPPAALAAPGAPQKAVALQSIAATTDATNKLALEIWRLAETSYKETKSSALLQNYLADAGFAIEPGVAGLPTAFTATFGSGKPVIGILGEFDALPGLSQAAVPVRQKRDDANDAGHACGHNLLGAGSAQAAVAVKAWMQSTGQRGTLRFYGCPAEEGGAGKAYMARAGLFDGVDAVLHWHPNRRNQLIWLGGTEAVISTKFRFHGQSAHAAAAPWLGRSALDGVEAMNNMANLLREHVRDDIRIHYVITNGGDAPNVVPAFAEVYYYVRAPGRDITLETWERVKNAAFGAALGTGTTVDWEIIHGDYEILPNDTLARVMHENLAALSDLAYDAAETAFAEKIAETLPGGPAPLAGKIADVAPLRFGAEAGFDFGSTDVGDVSWNAPTVGVFARSVVPGTRSHTWQFAAAAGSSIGLKGMNLAARTIACAAADFFTQPETLAAARAEFERRRGPGFKYTPLFGDRPPPIPAG
jgi:aminobenzoyl-glutamate utilization protein B